MINEIFSPERNTAKRKLLHFDSPRWPSTVSLSFVNLNSFL